MFDGKKIIITTMFVPSVMLLDPLNLSLRMSPCRAILRGFDGSFKRDFTHPLGVFKLLSMP